ncbi:hypothetical protein WHX56_13935 [Achromobacter veterisilvae]|uniref:Uncharacterized protein n=1 Tax=Achromobacter veterisilvae TaxID=2069367 RepID=A0ABZ2S8V4_9BURK
MTMIPAGFKLVPIEPTETMVVAGFESAPDLAFSSEQEWKRYEAMTGCQKAAHKARLCYAAMIAAAPPPPASTAGAQEVLIDFARTGIAGPFPIIDGKVAIPALTVFDMVHAASSNGSLFRSAVQELLFTFRPGAAPGDAQIAAQQGKGGA